MSSKASGSKWVSTRVLQQKQQHGPPTPPTSTTAPAPAAGSKIMEDKAIAAARIKENQGNPISETEVPESKVFEVQEATDALSNLAHNADATIYEVCGEAVIKPNQTEEAFHTLIMEQVQQQTK